MCVPTKAEAQHIFFWKQKLRMLAESLTHEQRNKNAILYLLVAKPEKINETKSCSALFLWKNEVHMVDEK